jgi:DmsE family decaheme c-type cytochrome
MKAYVRVSLASVLVAAAIPFTGQLAAAQQTGSSKAKPANIAGATYVGSEACGMCHEDIGKALPKSPHGAVEAGNVPSFMSKDFKGKACESCHGPGSKHVESLSAADIRNPAKMPAPEVDRTCLTCHRNQPTTSGRLEASHAHNDIACTACHSVHAHGPQGLVSRKPADINGQCESCHLDVKASFMAPFKHRVPENAMTCVDCHNPHGSFKPGLQRLAHANEPGCLNCHTDKRGPFAFEHSPVRDEGCQSCHAPHGSANARMLIRQEVRLVCLECHANFPASNSTPTVRGVVPPSFHDLTSPMYRNCTVCHQKIHGSHIDRNLLR